MSTNNSVCGSFMNFQQYNNVHTVVPVYTSNAGGQQMTVLENGYNDFVLTVGAGDTYSVTTHEWFADAIYEAYWWLIGQIGMDAVDAIAISNQGGSN